jgi:cytoskeletal protein CcmA (bactofilin family)
VKKNPNDFSLIDNGLTVDGTITCTGKLVVKGCLRGKVDGENIIIAEDGLVQAELTAKSVSIGGRFEGTIRNAEELIVLSTGVCSGSINCGVLVLEPGGILNAEVSCEGKGGGK